jgi:hypothetical protein
MLKNANPDSVATAFANMVFPVPDEQGGQGRVDKTARGVTRRDRGRRVRKVRRDSCC